VIEQVLARWKTAVVDNWATEIAKVQSFTAPTGMVDFQAEGRTPLRTPQDDDVYDYMLPDDLRFDRRLCIDVVEVGWSLDEAYKADTATNRKRNDEVTWTARVTVTDPSPEEAWRRCQRSAWVLRVVTEMNLEARQNSAGINTGLPYFVRMTTARSTGAFGIETGRAAECLMDFRALEQVNLYYTSI
jgi:hypothetical protein